MKCCWEYWCWVWQAKRGHKISANVSIYGWEALLGCMSWSQAGDPEVMAGFLPKSSSWPVTLLLSAPGLWSLLPANDLWFCLRITIDGGLTRGHQTHFTCALHQIWSQRWRVCILTQGDTYYLSLLLWNQFI